MTYHKDAYDVYCENKNDGEDDPPAPLASSACPICGFDKPHAHSQEELLTKFSELNQRATAAESRLAAVFEQTRERCAREADEHGWTELATAIRALQVQK